MINLRPDVVSLLVGTNDVHYYLENGATETFDTEDWERRYRSLLDSTLTALPDVKLVIGTPFTMKSGRLGAASDYALRDSPVGKLAAAVRHIATDYNAVLVPYDSLFTALREEHTGVAPEYWIWDGIHPTPVAHRHMATLWVKKADATLIP